MLRILHDTNYDFIRWWKVMAAITIAFIVLQRSKKQPVILRNPPEELHPRAH